MPAATSEPNASIPRYGFQGRLRAEFPSQIIADTTEVCNLACTHCTHPLFKRSEHYHARMLSPELNRKLVDEVRTQGSGITQYLRYSGNGEPLLNRHIFDMLSYAVSASGTTVTLTTNGTLLDSDKAERLLATGVHLIDISLDAYREETYRRIRVNGDLTQTRKNVERLIELARRVSSPTKVVVSFIEQPENASEIPLFESHWRDQGAHEVVVRRLHTNANSAPTASSRVNAPEGARRPCLYPWERILLNPSGKLAFCPQDWVHGSIVADYAVTTIREVWSSPVYRLLREVHLCGDYSNHHFCAQCPDWATTRWPGQGLSYSDLVASLAAPAR